MSQQETQTNDSTPPAHRNKILARVLYGLSTALTITALIMLATAIHAALQRDWIDAAPLAFMTVLCLGGAIVGFRVPRITKEKAKKYAQRLAWGLTGLLAIALVASAVSGLPWPLLAWLATSALVFGTSFLPLRERKEGPSDFAAIRVEVGEHLDERRREISTRAKADAFAYIQMTGCLVAPIGGLLMTTGHGATILWFGLALYGGTTALRLLLTGLYVRRM